MGLYLHEGGRGNQRVPVVRGGATVKRWTRYSDGFKWAVTEKLNKGLKLEVASRDYGLQMALMSRWKRQRKEQEERRGK